MEVDMETMLDIALAGPEIGPLNLHVLHGLMRNVFEKMNISKQTVVVDDDRSEFSDSCNFIKSKLEKIPKAANGDYRRLRSKVSVIVSNYARVPIGEQHEDLDAISQCPLQIEERLKCVESALSSMKDFPSVDELRDWAKDKSSPDTVVTDLWHFVSLNHRMNGAEEGIQKLTELVDKLIPELKTVWDKGMSMSGRIDDLYSQFKGLSDRMTYIDDKIDTASKEIVEKMNDIEKRMNELPTYSDLKDFVHMDHYLEAEFKAKEAANDIREALTTKLDAAQADALVSKNDMIPLNMRIDEIDDKLCETLKELDTFVSKDDHKESELNLRNTISVLEQKLNDKAEAGNLEDLQSNVNEKCSVTSKEINQLREFQNALDVEIKNNREKIEEKSNVSDISALTAKVDLNETIVDKLEEWRAAFETEDKPLIMSKINQHDTETRELNDSLSTLKDAEMKKQDGEGEKLLAKDLLEAQNLLQNQFKAHAKTSNDSISDIFKQLDNKLNRNEMEPLKKYLENCYRTITDKNEDPQFASASVNNDSIEVTTSKDQLSAIEQEGVSNIEKMQPFQARISPMDRNKIGTPQNADKKNFNGTYHPMPPFNDRSRSAHHPPPSRISPKRFSTNESLGCSHPQYDSQFVPYRDDAAIVRTQMKFNCLSCGRPLCMQANNQIQTTRGKPVNAYDLENMRLLQNTLNQENIDKEKRSCGGRHTTVIPLNNSAKPSAKILPMVSTNTTSHNDEEVDIEGIDGRLYRGLVSKNELPMLQTNTT